MPDVSRFGFSAMFQLWLLRMSTISPSFYVVKDMPMESSEKE